MRQAYIVVLAVGIVVLTTCAPSTSSPAATVAVSTPSPSPTTRASATVFASAAPTVFAIPTPSAIASPSATARPPVKGDAANGAKLFPNQVCSSCHDITKPYPGGFICPNLGNIATEAERIIKLPEYHGKATDAAGYIRESILDPNAYIVPGNQYRAEDGQSVMPKNFGQILKPSEIDDLIAFLLTLK